MSHSLKVAAVLTAKPGQEEALKELLLTLIGPSRAEEGNLRYDLWQDQANPGQFLLDELYTGQAAIASHRETPHFRNYLAKINDLATRTAFVLDAVQVA